MTPQQDIKPSLNEAQLALLNFLGNIKTEAELQEIQKLIARHLLARIRQNIEGLAEELGVDTEEGYEGFIEKNHRRTPYQ
jgi:phosphoribosyl-dephospho-CoA transferase